MSYLRNDWFGNTGNLVEGAADTPLPPYENYAYVFGLCLLVDNAWQYADLSRPLGRDWIAGKQVVPQTYSQAVTRWQVLGFVKDLI